MLDWNDTASAYYLAVVAFIVAYTLARWIVVSSFGSTLAAVRDNDDRATYLGYDVAAIKRRAFTISGMFAGFAGALWAHHQSYVSPELLHWTLSGQFLIMTWLGGVGTLIGPFDWRRRPHILCRLSEFDNEKLADRLRRSVHPRRALRARGPMGDRDPSCSEESTVSLLDVRGLTKRFGQLTAVRHLDLDVAAGERHAIIGSNGAGKTSLFHMITGRLRPTMGNVHFRDTEITALAPHHIARMGLARSFQITNIFPHLSVRENLRLGIQAQHRYQRAWWSHRSIMSDTAERATHLLGRLNLLVAADAVAGNSPYGDQRRLEIGLALALDPVLILLDEPTAGMSLAATDEIVDLLRQIPREVTILLIEHDIDVVLKLSDRVTVMHQGEVLAQGTPNEVERNARVQDAYFGGGIRSDAGDHA